MRKNVLILSQLAITISLFLVSADGQDFSYVIPELKNQPAPQWVKEGTRMSYYSATAFVPAVNEKFIPDEEGNWVGVKSGKRYRREEIFGSAGHGVTQVDVLSVEGGLAALKINSWLYSTFTGPLVPIKQGAYIGPAGGGDWYIHPQVLANLQERRGGGVTILRMPYQLNERTYNAVRIQQEDERSIFAHVYDMQDGKLLATFNSVVSPDGSGTTFAYATLLGVRDMDLPWLGQNLPQWPRKGSVLRYDGTKTYEAKRAAYTYPVSISLELVLNHIGQRYYTYSQTSSVSASGFPTQYYQDSQISGGIGETGGIILPPAALAALREGQVIDIDPVTGITVSVKDVGRDATGRSIVTLQASNQAYSAETTYDVERGVMIAFSDFKWGEEVNEYTNLQLTHTN